MKKSLTYEEVRDWVMSKSFWRSSDVPYRN